MVRALGGEPPRNEWRWAGRAGCDWEGAENVLAFAAIDADAWQAIRSRRRAEAVAFLRSAAEPAEVDGSDRPRRRVSDVLDAIDSLTEVDEVLEQVARAAKEPDADYGALERRVGRVLDRLGSDDPRRGHAETLRAVTERGMGAPI